MKSMLLCFALIGATIAIAARFSTVADAEKAGYFRFTNVDKSGAISYSNLNWQSIDQHHRQLWYSPDGRLLGADYSIIELLLASLRRSHIPHEFFESISAI